MKPLRIAFTTVLAGLMTLGVTGSGQAAPTILGLPASGAVCDPAKPGCGGVQPGAVLDPRYEFAPGVAAICTMNVLFTGSDGTRYVSTAGHCASDAPGRAISDGQELRWSPGTGQPVFDGRGNRIGEWAYANLNLAQARDFALIRLNPGVSANPRILGIGGPTGINNDISTTQTTLRFYGQGVVASDGSPARTAVAFNGLNNPDVVTATAAVTPGDSGAPFITLDGRIVGDLSGANPTWDDNTAIIPRIGPQVARAAQVLGTRLTLVTAAR